MGDNIQYSKKGRFNMITGEDINKILQIKESFKLPEKLMSILLNSEERGEVFQKFLDLETDLSFDWFTNYFQEQHSNRDNMMQDFTPAELTKILPSLAKDFKTVVDVCAGTGGLSIACWNKNHDAEFYCEELSERALPLLLFNMSIRNITGYIVNKDVLSNEVFAVYKLTKSERFSDITTLENPPEIHGYDLCVMNPPYSVKWKYDEKKNPDKRFEEYGYAPSAYADFAFVVHGLNMISEKGELFAILPHGVLFRGNKESDIRKKFIEKKNLKAIIGLPDKLFLNTQIPVCIIALDKSNNEKTIFIDASKTVEKGTKQNTLKPEHTEKIADTYKNLKEVERYSHIATPKEFEDNDYNMNISRYVDTYVPPETIDIIVVTEELAKLEEKRRDTNRQLLEVFKELKANTSDSEKELDAVIANWERVCRND